MTKLKRGKYGRRVNSHSHSGFGGIRATVEMTTGEFKQLVAERKRQQAQEAADRRQRDIRRRGYA